MITVPQEHLRVTQAYSGVLEKQEKKYRKKKRWAKLPVSWNFLLHPSLFPNRLSGSLRTSHCISNITQLKCSQHDVLG